MEAEMLKILDECLLLLEEMQQRQEKERDGIRTCLGGAPLEEYLKNTDKAASAMRRLRQSLLSLQTELTAGL